MKTSSIVTAVAALAAALVPISVLAAPDDLYVTTSSEVLKFDSHGLRKQFADGLNTPAALAFDGVGNLFVAEFGTNIISKFTPSGVKSMYASALEGPNALAFDSLGNLYVTSFFGGRVIRFNSGSPTLLYVGGLNQPIGIAVDRAGNLFVAENGTNSIIKVAPDRSKTTFASGLNQPYALTFDGAGNLYEADFGSNSIFKFTPAGVKTTFATGLNQPTALAFDSAGVLYQADQGTGQVFAFIPSVGRVPWADGLSGQISLAVEPTRHTFRNISTRSPVGTADNVLIGGFIVGGNGSVDGVVLIRAIGPSLSALGVAGALQDPTLELHGPDGMLITTNDNWKTRPDGSSQQALIESTSLAPGDDRESAIYANLPAGNYTAIVRGVSNTTGVALVEVYNLQ